MQKSQEYYNERRNKLLKELNLSYEKPYQEFFDPKMVSYGVSCVQDKKVSNLIYNENVIECSVSSFFPNKPDSQVKVILNSEDKMKIDSASCTCKKFKETGKYCEHIYAAVYSISDDVNLKKVKEELKKYKEKTTQIVQRYELFVQKYKNKFSENERKIITENLGRIQRAYDIDMKLTNDKGFHVIYYLDNIRCLDELCETIEIEINRIKKETKKMKKSSGIGLFTILGALFSGFFGGLLESGKTSEHQYSDKELDDLGIFEEDEREAIRSGDYEPENFDMDNWDEDNYYWDEDENKPE